MSTPETKIKSTEFIRGITGTDPILDDPLPHVAFVGRSNVGKSSVINCLLARNDLARSSSTPGKTVRLNFYLINKDLYFVDLPGFGYAKTSADKAEKIRRHIIWYLSDEQVREHLRGVVHVTDAKAGLTDYDHDMLEIIANEGHPLLLVLNKADKLNQSERHHAMNAAFNALDEHGLEAPVTLFSATKKQGREKLLDTILSAT